LSRLAALARVLIINKPQNGKLKGPFFFFFFHRAEFLLPPSLSGHIFRIMLGESGMISKPFPKCFDAHFWQRPAKQLMKTEI
jgi:hypothetical protein